MKKKTVKFIVFAIVLIIIKQLLMSHIPITALGESGGDDQLMVKLASNLLKLNWLGEYNHLTLVKGMFFPLFLAINTALGISYINAITLLYSISCIVFIYFTKDLYKKEYTKYIIFTILLFNPIMNTFSVVQRVYRNSLTPSQVLLIISSMFYLFTNRKKDKKIFVVSIFCGIVLATFYNTREDAIWILPFIIIFIIIMIIEHIVINKKNINYKKIIIFIIPLIILLLSNNVISLINYKEYGVYVRVDESNSSFSKAIDAIYSVPPNENIQYVSVTKEKLERIYNISPTLKSISPNIEKFYDGYDKSDRKPGDGEVEDGWFWWLLRFAVNDAGYYENSIKANDFYNKVTNEIKVAQKNRLIGKQKTMPSALMSPWRKGYFEKLVNTFYKVIIFTNKFENLRIQNEISSGSFKNIGLFEDLTNDKAIYPFNTSITVLFKSDKVDKISLVYEDNYLDSSLCDNNQCFINYNSSDKINGKDIFLDFYENNEHKKINIYDYFYNEELKQNNLIVNYFSNYEVVDNQLKLLDVYAKKINIFSYLYEKLGLIIGAISFVLYTIFTYIAIFRKKEYLDRWLIITSILATYIVLCLGVSYNHISSCDSITDLYLSGAYPLIIVFDLLVIFTFIENKILKLK